ncbi:MAG: hypothetical protein U5N53_28420 [Mycobacterium sp.]|nr:hypothetical protein [Mycobacterium sp.]
MADLRRDTLSVCADAAPASLYGPLSELVDGQLVLTAAEHARIRTEATTEIGARARGPIIAVPVVEVPEDGQWHDIGNSSGQGACRVCGGGAVMNKEQRRRWVRMVLGHGELKPTAKLVLLALETHADYDDGSNAHPGEVLLASEVGGVTLRAVQLAMSQGRALGLIERTAAANPKAHLAAVWRLTLPVNVGRAEQFRVQKPVQHERTFLLKHLAPEQLFVLKRSFYPNERVVSTRTTVRPTLPAPSPLVETSGGGGTQVGTNDPRPQCHLHEENTDEVGCRYCKRRRLWDEAHPGWRERSELERRRQLREIANNCPVCHGALVPDTNPAVRCTHESQEARRG